MKRVLTILIICILCVSTFSIFTPHVRALDLFSLLWTKNTAQTVCSIAVGDINRDGKNEVVYSDWAGTVYAVDSSGNALWNYPTGWYGKIKIGDLQGDGRQEVVVASANHNIYCLDGATGGLLWSYATAELAGHGDLVLADVNGDGKLEVVTGEWDSNVYFASPANVYVVDCNGNLVWKYTVAEDVVPTASDVNNDGKAEVVAYYGRPQLVSTGYLYMFTADGQVRWSVSILGCAWMVPLFVDVNGDGTKEIVTCRSSDNAILVFRSSDGYLLRTISQSFGWLWDVVDLNHDGQFEFLTCNGNVVSALDSNGNMMWQASVSGSVYALVSADLYGDGLKEVVVGSTGTLSVLSSTGSTMWSTTMQDDVGNIRVADITGDGLPDVVAGTSLSWPNQTPPEIVSAYKNVGGPAPPPVTYSVFFEGSGVGNPAQVWSVTLDGYGTEYSNGPGNTIHTIVFTGVANGGPYQFTVTPPSGFVAQPTADPITVNGGDFHQPITFSPVPVTYTFALAAGSGGSVSYLFSLGSGTVLSGQPQQLTVPQSCQFTITANPDSLHVFQNWSPTGSVSVSNTSSASTAATVNGNGGVTANFAYNLGVSIFPTSASIQSGDSVTFTATASGGSGSYTYVWFWMEYGTANHDSYNSGSSSTYTFARSEAGNYGVYVVVTDSSGKTGQSLSSPVTVTDFQLKISPQTQTVPITENARFVLQVVPINGFSGSVTLGHSNMPTGILCGIDPSTIKPPQTSAIDLAVTGNAQVGSYSISITAASGQLVHQQTVTIHVTKTVGLMNIMSISHVSEAGALPAFSIQQNFYVIVPSSSTLFRYWAQNVVLVKQNLFGGYQVAVATEIFNLTDTGQRDLIDGSPWPQGRTARFVYQYSISLPVTFNMTSAISGNNLVLSNNFSSWTWPLPSGNGQQPYAAFILNYGLGISGNPPECVLVGDINSAQASFQDPTDGSVKSFGKLMGQDWTSCLAQSVASSITAQTGESSLGVRWDVTGVDTAGFFYESGSDKEGIFFVPLGSSTLQGGAAMEDQTPLTGVSVSIVGSTAPDGTSVAIATTTLSGVSTDVVQVGTNPAAYYDVNVQGISDGTATICITNSGVLGQTMMQYWNGAQWVMATDVVVSGNTICGNIPVSALTGTPIAIGPIVDNTPPTTGIVFGQPSIKVAERVFLTGSTPVSLTATDNQGGSGVSLTTYKVCNNTFDSDWLTYNGACNLSSYANGNYTIAYNSTDNAGNIEKTNTVQVTLFSWNYVFTDSQGRGTVLQICTQFKLFQFIAPDKDFGVKYDSNMRILKHVIIIGYEDKEMRLVTTAVDDRIDFCSAICWDKQTRKHYLLIDKPDWRGCPK